jgi:hypothetical protein
VFNVKRATARDGSGTVVTPLSEAGYREMLAIIEQGREEALAQARVDMPGAKINYGVCRQLVPVPLPDKLPALTAKVGADSAVDLSWGRTPELMGLRFEIHRSNRAGFAPSAETRVTETSAFGHLDAEPPAGTQHYALVLESALGQHSAPVRATVNVPPPAAPAALQSFSAAALPGEVALEWKAQRDATTFNLDRAAEGSDKFEKLNAEPLASRIFRDDNAAASVAYRYTVRAVSRRGIESAPAPVATATALPESRAPVFVAAFGGRTDVASGSALARPALRDGAKLAGGALVLGNNGHAEFPHRADFDLRKRLSVECWVRFEQPSQMPVVLSCGHFNGKGWFIQRFGRGWRWHLGGVSCDGGLPAPMGKWIHLVATFDGKLARLFQDGVEIASKECDPDRAPSTEPLRVGQYSGVSDPYQVHGQIAGVKIYRRALSAEEAAANFRNTTP